MNNKTRLEMIAALLYGEPQPPMSISQVAAATGRNPQTIRGFIKRGRLPATLNDRGEYRIEHAHAAAILFFPTRKGTRKVEVGGKTLQQPVVPKA